MLEAVAARRGGPRATLVLIDDLDPFRGPSQVSCATGQVVLAGGAGGVLAHLNRRGLPDVDQRKAVEMVSPDLRGVGACRHR
jgi:hypothetical protein